MSSLSVNVMSVGLKVYLSFWFAGGKSNVRKVVIASLSSLIISSSLPFSLSGAIILVATTSTSPCFHEVFVVVYSDDVILPDQNTDATIPIGRRYYTITINDIA